MEKSVIASEPKVVEVRTVEQLKDYLASVKDAPDSDTALSSALNAQLQVLSVINSPTLTISAYDLMLDSLKTAVEEAKTTRDKKEYQRIAAIMTNSMIFFLEAKLYWEGKKWSKDGQELLKLGCNLLVESSIALLKMKTGAVLLSEDFGSEMFENLIRNIGGFFNKLFDRLGAGGRIKKYRGEFYTFLPAVFDKMHRYGEVYGAQPILSELVLRYKDVLVPVADDKTAALKELNPDNEALSPLPPFKDYTLSERNGIKIGSVILGILAILYFFNWWGGDKWLESFANSSAFETLFTIHFSILELPFLVKFLIAVIFIALLVINLFKSIALADKPISEYNSQIEERLEKIADEYFVELAKSYRL